MRVGVVYRNDCWNPMYRATGIADLLLRRGISVHGHQFEPHLPMPHELLACDVVHIFRRADDKVRAFVNEAHRRGIGVTWDNDDDLRRLPDMGTKISKFEAERHHVAALKMIRSVDVVTTTTEVLKGTYEQGGAERVRIVENYVHPMQCVGPAPPSDGPVIGWVAGNEHIADARALDIASVLRRAMERHKELRVTTVGVRLGGLDPKRYRHHRGLPFLHLKDEIRTWSLGIAPLADIPMSYARSNVKLKEYAAAGVPWLASARGPYAGMGPGQGGHVVGDEAWDAAIDVLLTDGTMLPRLASRAAAWGSAQRLDQHLGKWIRVFEEAISVAQSRATSATGAGLRRSATRAETS